MKRVATAFVVALVLLPGATSAAPSAGRERAYVSAEDEDLLVAVDLESSRVVARVRVPNGPHNVDATSDGRVVAVTSPPAGKVTVLDGRTLRVRRTFGGFGYPHDVDLTADGRFAWVTDERRDEVVVLDLRRATVSARIAVSDGPHDLVVTDRVLVTHSPSASALTVIDRRSGRVSGRVFAGRGPHDIAFQPDSANVYLTFWDSGSVAAVDWGRRRVLFRRRVGTLTHHLAFDGWSGRRLWVSDHVGGRIMLLEARSGRVLRSFDGCPGAHHVAVGPKRIVGACHESGRIVVFRRGRLTRSSVHVGHGLHGVDVATVS